MLLVQLNPKSLDGNAAGPAASLVANVSRTSIMPFHRSFVGAALPLLTTIVFAASGTACSNPFGGGACTEIGCSDGLLVTFDTPPPHGSIVELDNATGFPWRVECGIDWNCDFGIFFADFTPDHVRVRVVTPDGEVIQSFRPTYQKLQPNGDDCPPTCLNATILVELPTA